jgi:hypothetical protein
MGHHELHDAIATCKRLQLPIQFDIEYVPFRLISPNCLCERSKVDKQQFYRKMLGQEKWESMMQVLQKWKTEKDSKL